MKRKRLIAGLLTVTMLTTALVGCSPQQEQSQVGNGESKSTVANSETGSQNQETKTYSMFIGDSWVSTIIDPAFQDSVAQELTAKTGVTFDIDMVQSDNPDSEINILLASGDLPDCMFVGGSIRSQMIRDGYVIELSDLVASNGNNIQENLGFVFPQWQEEDGSLYGLGCFVWNDSRYALNLSVNTLHMRYDILKELGFEKLDRENPYDSFITIDEYMALLDQVCERYPDMIPALFDKERVLEVMMKSKGIQFTNINNSTYTSFEDGQGKSLFSSKYLPDIITFLNEFYRNGYAPDGVLNYTLEENEALLSTGEVFSTLGSVEGLDTAISTFQATGEDNRYVMFYLRESEDITDLFINNYATTEAPNMMITTDCEDPEGLMDFFNFCASEEGSTIIGAGVEGVTYTTNEDGTLTPTDEMATAYAQWDVNLIKKYGVGNWLNVLPSMEGIKEDGHAYDINAEAAFTSDPWVSYNNKDYLHFAYPRIISAAGRLDSEEDAAAYDALSKISTYAFDRIAKAIMAETPEQCQEEWETCVQQMQNDGLADLDAALDKNWRELAEAYGVEPDALLVTDANKVTE